jgi:carbon-monoxide dehydrogenase large subunit
MKNVVGKPVKRVEDPRLIQGKAVYVDDLSLPGMLHAAIARSPHAHARITGIRTEGAKALPGVKAVLTGADVNPHVSMVASPDLMPGQKSPKHSVLAGNRVYYVGHAVAVVVASDRTIARDALDLLEVDYDPLPAVTDMERAVEKGSPLTHPELGTNVAYTWDLQGGDAAAGFKAADLVLKIRMRHPRVIPMPIEPRGCVAAWQAGDESLTLWTSTQIPHLIRMLLPKLIGVPEHRIRIIAPEVGGGFGAKLNLYPEELLLCHLARRLGAPVKWIESRRENAATTIHGRDQIGDYEVAVKKNGSVLAIRSRTLADLGSYLQMGTPAIPTLTGLMLPGCYKLRGVDIQVMGIHTNKMATDAYRGAGRPEATYTIERIMDIVAAELRLDPVEVRLTNFVKPAEFPYRSVAGVTYDSGNYAGALEKAQDLASWEKLLKERDAARREGRLSGVGLSTYVEICSFGPSRMMSAGGWEWGSVRIEMSGLVTVITGATPHGQGQETSFAQIAADRLGVDMSDILVLRGDTSIAPYGRDTYGSRATAIGGTAILMSVDKIVDKAKILAAHLLKSTPKQLEYRGGRFFVRGKSAKALTWRELASEAYHAKNIPKGFEPGLEASSFFEPPNCTFPFGTHIAAVQIDRETGEIKLRKYIAVDDCGNRINPLLVEGQIQGGIAHSIGQALTEHTVYSDDGQLITGEFTDYAIPRASDIPDYVMGSTVTPSPSNPMGVKGVGEAGTIGAAPAIANAVIDALSPLGIRHLDMPFTPERVWRAIHDASTRPQVSSESKKGGRK